MDELIIYTDGGCHGNPGPGGWGCVIIDESDGQKKIKKLSGGEKQTTNNRMELTAAIEALQSVALEGRKIVVYSDSQYVKNGITSWIKNWKKNGWKTASKKSVLNQDLWIQLDMLYNSLDVEWKWVKGHAGVEYNEVCDGLCQMEIAKFE